MQMKIASLISATAIVLITAASNVTASESYNHIIMKGLQEQSATIKLDIVRASEAGRVDIADYRTGQIGAVLGATDIRAGVKTDVKVQTGMPVRGNGIALLYDASGNLVGTEEIDVKRN